MAKLLPVLMISVKDAPQRGMVPFTPAAHGPLNCSTFPAEWVGGVTRRCPDHAPGSSGGQPIQPPWPAHSQSLGVVWAAPVLGCSHRGAPSPAPSRGRFPRGRLTILSCTTVLSLCVPLPHAPPFASPPPSLPPAAKFQPKTQNTGACLWLFSFKKKNNEETNPRKSSVWGGGGRGGAGGESSGEMLTQQIEMPGMKVGLQAEPVTPHFHSDRVVTARGAQEAPPFCWLLSPPTPVALPGPGPSCLPWSLDSMGCGGGGRRAGLSYLCPSPTNCT